MRETGGIAVTLHWEHHFILNFDKFQMIWEVISTSLSYWQTYQRKARLTLCSGNTNAFPLLFSKGIIQRHSQLSRTEGIGYELMSMEI